MRLHAVVAVVGAQLQEFGQVAVPGIEVDRDGALAHAELVDRDGGIVDDADPPDHAARDAGEASDRTAGRADLAEVHTHAAAGFRHLREVVDAAVDAGEAVGHRVDEAARELVVGLAGIREGRRRHRDLEARQHVVGALDPLHAVGLFPEGQVERDAQVHLLRALEQLVIVRADGIAFEHEVEAGVGE